MHMVCGMWCMVYGKYVYFMYNSVIAGQLILLIMEFVFRAKEPFSISRSF